MTPRAERSYKAEILRNLFSKRWNPTTKEITDPIVSTQEVLKEHAAYRGRKGQPVETTNPYAFMKDLLRSSKRNENWPAEILEAGFTARQVTGEGRVFEFIRLAPGQTEPFPLTVPTPPSDEIAHRISSVSLPLASRRLGRGDEPWLIQVSVRLHIVESYFALFSTRKATIQQVDHLQNTVKLRRTEIDSLFLGIEESAPNVFTEFMITCEAKHIGEDIIVEQVLEQVKAVFHLENITQTFVVPLALKSISPSRIHVVEFGAVQRDGANDLDTLSIVNHAIFDLVPPVPGIGVRSGARKSKPKRKSNT